MSPPAPSSGCTAETIAARVRLGGRVQGVGYRPFVFQLARQYQLAGSVRNLLGEVEVIAEGRAHAIEEFARRLISHAPPLALPRLLRQEALAPAGRCGFVILQSDSRAEAAVCVPPDLFTCADCLRELQDPRDRRYGYPFINCTQCGPRYTLIDAMPYDRSNTTMAHFSLCDACRAEYEDADNRRFHAEPVACPNCGPQLRLDQSDAEPIESTHQALQRAVGLLKTGAVLAVKGIGGYHLMCDARNAAAVSALRERKRRPHKPLAVMFPQAGADGLASVREHIIVDADVQDALLAPERPIVLAIRRSDSTLAPQVAPGLDEIGVLLPYSPIHHLLLRSFGGPLVATSGNRSGEPVFYDDVEASTQLASIADAFLHHDRRIARPADDSVIRFIAGRTRMLRLGRGVAPLELDLSEPVPQPLLAVGGHMKTTVALAWQSRVVISPHIGDMDTARSERVFAQVVEDLQQLYGVRASAVVCDAHPRYATTRWARTCGLPVTMVQHHHAHASALVGEHSDKSTIDEPSLIFTWDGVGYGSDGTLWGGEALLGRPGHWHRVASMRPFRLPGAERAGRAPWRSAAALCWETGTDWHANPAEPLVRQAWERSLNSPTSSAVGRIFDAAAAIVLGVHEVTFEGQAPMLLEACASAAVNSAAALPMYQDAQLLRADWAPLIANLVDTSLPADARAGYVHATLAQTIVETARRLRRQHAFNAVGLTGGVFQNRKLTEWAADGLRSAGFRVWLNERIPCNDGGLSFGQVVDACGSARRTTDDHAAGAL